MMRLFRIMDNAGLISSTVGLPTGPSAQIVGIQGPQTIQSMDFGASTLTIWVLGPSGTNLEEPAS